MVIPLKILVAMICPDSTINPFAPSTSPWKPWFANADVFSLVYHIGGIQYNREMWIIPSLFLLFLLLSHVIRVLSHPFPVCIPVLSYCYPSQVS